MKKTLNNISYWLTALVVSAIMILASSCKENNEQSETEAPKRIHTIESNFSTSTYIIEVDDHEYLVNYHGGIYHLESCPCKNK